jgi:hypothetical protein
MYLRLVVDIIQYMVQPWVFHDGSLPRDAFSQIEVLMGWVQQNSFGR